MQSISCQLPELGRTVGITEGALLSGPEQSLARPHVPLERFETCLFLYDVGFAQHHTKRSTSSCSIFKSDVPFRK